MRASVGHGRDCVEDLAPVLCSKGVCQLVKDEHASAGVWRGQERCEHEVD